MLTVLVSHIYAEDPELMGRLRSRFPEVVFVAVGREPPFAPAAREGKVLLYGALTKPVLSGLLNYALVEWIHTGTAGFDWLMVPEVEARGIPISRTLHAMDTPIAEFVMAAMLAHFKNLSRLLEAQQRRAWEPPMHGELYGKTLLVVGAGSIGSRVAGYARAFGMRVLGTKRSPEPQPEFHAVFPPSALRELLPAADVTVLACPLTPETRHMLGHAEFQAMKRESYLINIARGALIVEAELIRAIEEGLIAGACLDVFETEPLPPDSPLWGIPNLFITPHCSYRSPHVRARVIDEFSENLERYLRGEPVKNTMRHAALGY
ncbi:MAG: D-2-hydroxyacid dehydrogenase [Meiothermus sp.]|nr:D-2-hydroxyacid dehydrogenase [Meiothermus sp.]